VVCLFFFLTHYSSRLSTTRKTHLSNQTNYSSQPNVFQFCLLYSILLYPVVALQARLKEMASLIWCLKCTGSFFASVVHPSKGHVLLLPECAWSEQAFVYVMKFGQSDIPPLHRCKHVSIKGLQLIMLQKQNTSTVSVQILHR